MQRLVLFYGFMAFAGGMAGQLVLGLVTSQAAQAASDRQVVSNRLYLMAPEGGMRIQAGTYDQPSEKGLPLIGMSDNKDHLRLLFRLAGSNESPVLVMKDKKGADRLVMGLGMNGVSEEPFIEIVDDRGSKTDLVARLK